MFCVLVYTILTCWLLHRTQSDPKLQVTRKTKECYHLSPVTCWLRASLWAPSLSKTPALPPRRESLSPQDCIVCENSLRGKCRMQFLLHWTLLNSSSFLTFLIQRSFLDKLSTELDFSIDSLHLLNCSEIPSSDKWWTPLLCTSENTPTSKSPDVLLPFKTCGFPLPLGNSRCHSQYANANTRDFSKSNELSEAHL